jgi:hypothetical protein
MFYAFNFSLRFAAFSSDGRAKTDIPCKAYSLILLQVDNMAGETERKSQLFPSSICAT